MAGATSPSEGRGGTNPVQLGLGVIVGAIDNNMAGGSPHFDGPTDRPDDRGRAAISFSADGRQRSIYTRDGAFSLDAQNNLVSSSTGLKVLGWSADPLTGEVDTSGQITGSSGINIPLGLLSTAKADQPGGHRWQPQQHRDRRRGLRRARARSTTRWASCTK